MAEFRPASSPFAFMPFDMGFFQRFLNDASPTWETAKIGLKHIFSNAVKTAATWAVGVRVQINKTGGYDSIACYALSGSYI